MGSQDFGGRMRFRTSGGAFLSMRGTFNVMPTGQSVDGITGQDGTTDRIITPTARRIEFTFADGTVDAETLLASPRQNLTIIEDDTGRQHLLGNAFFTGEPSINRLTGEVSGMGAMGESYQQLLD